MKNHPYAVCFGETLWDIFPDDARAGGAPFNVAYHISRMGCDAKMLSKVGHDELGKKLIDQIREWGITTEYIQIDKEKPTSTVVANFDENNEAHYEIIKDVAWDYIEIMDQHQELIAGAEAFVFGSLCARNLKTRETLFHLLKHAKFRVFDVNFRPPFIDLETIKALLHQTDLVKMNKSELRKILEFFDQTYTTEEAGVSFIQQYFGIHEVILTKGSKGAKYFIGDQKYDFSAVPVEIGDTVGSGDAFLAGFLSKRLIGEKPETIMRQAVALGAFVTSQFGACPDYHYEQFRTFRDSRSCVSL
ncbi:carbohydrate kinase [Elizabethkingia argentiflava]|uniref:Carbohydrate kinase n=1 Tax=Elizabethkingia argenteiflava TaxID=2681556 RepID=A0A845Q0R6_9FLAO|nr:carbohydrate kinase [Elizabethkingia argenteiflava]NAW52238.1 carbohydrate kinase [Elizabethkingia argenteiflava]